MKAINHKSTFIQIVIILYLLSFVTFDVHADLEVKYQNKQKTEEFLHIFIKNKKIKIVSTQNTTKIVNLEDHNLLLYENQKDYYVKVPLKVKLTEIKEQKPKKTENELFSAKIKKTGKSRDIAGSMAVELIYSSSIDKTVKINAIKGGEEDVRSIINALRIIHGNGNEILKEAAYYYCLKEGYIPLRLSSMEFEWEAVKVNSEMADSVFSPPEELKERDYRLIFKDAVNNISKEIESEISIK